MADQKLTTQNVIVAIHELNGNLAAVGRRYGVTRQAVSEFKRRHPTVANAYEEARETMLDNAEDVLYHKVLSGEDTTALIFFLKTQGHKRGYVERHEHTGADGNDLNVVLKWSEHENGDEA